MMWVVRYRCGRAQRVHHWLSQKVPRDEAFRALVVDLCDLYTREPTGQERLVSLDEMTSIRTPDTVGCDEAGVARRPARCCRA